MTFRLTRPICPDEFTTFGEQERGPGPEEDGLSVEDHLRQCQLIPGGAETGLREELWYHGRGAVSVSGRQGIR